VTARRILVMVPAFREEENLPGVLGELAASRLPCDVLVIDDGSPDRSADVAREHGAMVVSHPTNRGYGAALVTGYQYALAGDHEVIVQMDADGQHDPAQIPDLVDRLLQDGTDVAFGSRMLAGGGHQASLPRLVGIHFFAWLGRRLTGRAMTDPTSGFAAMNRRAAAFLAENTPRDFPDLNVLVALDRAGLRVAEVPVSMRRRQSGQSQLRGILPLVYGPKVLLYLAQVYRSERIASARGRPARVMGRPEEPRREEPRRGDGGRPWPP
jgi:glycosyltransferase involved in cell wall biosynthesis